MSFDPQNPRGAPRPPAAPPSSPKPSNQIPPQPQRTSRGLSREVAIGGAVIAVLLIVLVVGFVATHPADRPSIPARSSPPASGTNPTAAGSPGSSSVPGTSASLTVPTLRPTPPSSVVAPSAGTPEAALLTHVPGSISATCATSAGGDGITVTATCSAATAGVTVSYDQYSDADTMNAAFDQLFAAAQIEPNTGSCEDSTTWPAESDYDVESEPAGRRLCTDQPGSPTIYWTDQRLNILSTASSSTGDPAGLLDFWANEAGPVP